jgi:hypothetical protein
MENIELFELSLEGLNPNTIKNHIRNVKKYIDEYDDEPADQSKILKNVSEDDVYKTQSAKVTILKSISKYLQYKGLPVDKIVEGISKYNNTLNKSYVEKNKEKKYPHSLKDLKQGLKQLEKDGKCQEYIINYILINYNTRIMDLDVKLVNKKPKDKENNYFYRRKNDIQYIRNIYKTSKQFGTKIHIIKNKSFLKCFDEMIENEDELLWDFNQPAKQLQRYMKKKILFGYNQSDLIKIILSEKNSLSQASKIGKNRGTTLSTLNINYNLKV